MSAAIVVTLVTGQALIPSEMLSDKAFSVGHVDESREKPTSITPEQQYVSLGLRHVISAELQEAVVVRVVDGDTIEVNIDGTRKKVRLVGINAPESVSPDESLNTEEGEKASQHLKECLKQGHLVYLQKDTSDTDSYGRLLRYVWLAEPTNFTDSEEVKAKMVNAKILADGYAVAHKYKPDDAYFDIFKAIQLDAFHAGKGLWANGTSWSSDV